MAKYALVKERDKDNHFDNSDVIIQFDAISLDDMLSSYEEFLRACGFQIETGSLTISESDE
jgi:hypothetical protein